MRGKSAIVTRLRAATKNLPLIRPCGATFPQGGRLRLSKKVRSPLSPLCEGAPPAGGGGENCTAARNISGYGKVLSLRPFGAPPSQREVFRHAVPPSRGEGFLIFASEASTPPYCCRACRCIRRAGSRQGPRRRGSRQEPGLRFQTRPRRTRMPWAGRGPRS